MIVLQEPGRKHLSTLRESTQAWLIDHKIKVSSAECLQSSVAEPTFFRRLQHRRRKPEVPELTPAPGHWVSSNIGSRQKSAAPAHFEI